MAYRLAEGHTHKESFKSNSRGVGGLFGDCQNKPEELGDFSLNTFILRAIYTLAIPVNLLDNLILVSI